MIFDLIFARLRQKRRYKMAQQVPYKDIYIINPDIPIEYLTKNGVRVSVVKKNGEAVPKNEQKITINAPRAASCMWRMMQRYPDLSSILGESAKEIIIYKSKSNEPIMALFSTNETTINTHVWNDVDDAVLPDVDKIKTNRDTLTRQAKAQFYIKK